MSEPVAQGRSFPLGATLCDGGANFSVFSKHSTAVELCLFDCMDGAEPARVIALDPRLHRTYHYWHVFVPGIAHGQLYAFRVHGPYDPANGLRFEAGKTLLDPYGKCVARPQGYRRQAARQPGDNAVTAFKSVVVELDAYDWEGDARPRRPFERTIIYEMHVGRFTRHPDSNVTAAERGTYTGLIRKIPYLQDLGITAVELLPVFAFDEQDAPAGLVNDWGYQPVSFFAPHLGYSSRQTPTEVLDDFRDMVKALHRAGIEVILDVVFNHTTEGGADGPTICFRGLANATYYILGEDKATYADYTGCGNTLNANEPVVRRMITDSLRHWVRDMHVDGFRFDLAAILSRDEHGRPMLAPPLIWDIETDPVLANVKLIAEAWDAGGLYEVGSFVGDAWKEWNGKFRDDVRSFLKSDNGMVRTLACRLTGSPDVYAWQGREPEQSINFVTCHDGFTLNDLVSYNTKHNAANGEQNRDGSDNNFSWNCGVEGPSEDPEIERLRTRQVKNFLALLLLSVGTPMLLAGDEVRGSQRGNNNAYCRNDELLSFDWTLPEAYAEIHRFTKQLIAFRLGRSLPADRFDMTLQDLLRKQPIQWHGVRLNAPDWSDTSHSIAATWPLISDRHILLHVIINAYWELLEFELPLLDDAYGPWRRCIDTSLAPPEDVCAPNDGPVVALPMYRAQPRSVVILFTQTRADVAAR
ncbi:glycogen debranching protein [Bradyrhizobium sp. NAS80.1]|uniref:glycogen debranching protein GlgX n=1 Tax=Bradyrhizobium sp. NAS80.1 TaxID=1680159 RepID=UPI00095EE795|nr:glycogen debranching protein GlgX [Bradyrhizobium sp. NAS80.1]OKO88025.1 glycogen debranching protein [Bradyrhizobium sp. NAS80.1]